MINTTKEQIKATPTFGKLDALQQKIILNKDNFEKIKNGVNVAKHKDLVLYKQEHSPQPRVLSIVTELLLNA